MEKEYVYVVPHVMVIEVEVEKGFAASPNEGVIETPEDDEW